MERQEYRMEEESNTGEYVKVIWKRKNIILGVFLVGIVISVIVSLLMPKTYKAVVILMITPSKMETIVNPLKYSLSIEEGIAKPTISLRTHYRLLQSDEVMQRIHKQKNVIAASTAFEVKEVTRTNLIELNVLGEEPKEITEIANVWAEEYVKVNQLLISAETSGSYTFLTKQLKVAEEKLRKAEDALNVFKDTYNLESMKQELQVKQKNLNDFVVSFI